MRSFAALGLLALAGLSTAQDQYNINPDDVPESTREYWCQQQESQCPLICLQQPGVKTQNTVANDCEWETLEYSCICDDNSAPNITKYTQTMPYFKCTEWGNQCEKNCGQDSKCANDCRANHPCGAQDPAKPNSTASASSSASPTPTKSESSDASATGRLGESNNNNSPGSGAMAVGASYGTMVLTFAGIFAAFAYL